MKMKRSLLLRVVYFPCLAVLMVTVFLLTFSVNVSAASDSVQSYPLIIDFAKNPADTTLEDIQNAFSIMWGDLPDSYILYCSGHDQRYLNGSHGWDYYDTFTYTISVNPVFDYPLEFSISSSYYYITNGVEYYFAYIPDLDHWGSYNSATNIRHQYSYSYMVQGLGWLLYGSEDEYLSTSDVVVWAHEPEVPVIVTGHAIAPDPFDTPVYSTGHAKPNNVPPIITFNHYTYNSTLSLGENLSGWFDNLVDNIQNGFNFIGDTIQYYGNLIISNIINGIQTFYNNLVSLFEPISENLSKIGLVFSTIIALGTDPETGFFSIPYLTQTLFMPDVQDMAQIMEANDSLHIISNVDRIVDKVWLSETSIIKTIHNVTPAKKFHIPSCIFHGQQIGDFDIDFSWFEPYKSYTDIIIGTFLIIGWIYWFFVSCSHILRYGKTYDYDEHEIGGGAGIGVRF